MRLAQLSSRSRTSSAPCPVSRFSHASSTTVPRLKGSVLPRLAVLGDLVGGILDSINNNLSTIVTGLGEVIGGLLEVVRELLGGLLGGLGGVLGGLLGGLGLRA